MITSYSMITSSEDMAYGNFKTKLKALLKDA